jgi:transcriptional regulator with XRE-family HTH domain
MESAAQIRTAFGERLRTLRTARGHSTARAVANLTGLDENRYARYERGEVEPSLATILKLCRALEVEPNELFGYPPSKSRQR